MSHESTDLPWGVFPAEQFLVRNWDRASALSPDDQRRELLRAFRALPAYPEDWMYFKAHQGLSRVPTAEEVRDILEPWRPAKLRRVAQKLQDRESEVLVLRTYYGDDNGNADDKWAGWLEEDRDADPNYDEDLEDDWIWRYLDDRDLFDFGTDWTRIFELLPELLDPPSPQSSDCKTRREPTLSRKYLEGQLGLGEQPTPPAEHELQLIVQKLAAAERLPLLVASERMFTQDDDAEYDVIYLDGYGNAVRHGTVCPQEVWAVSIRSLGERFEDATVAETYTSDGEMGRKLYPRALELLEN